MGHNIRKILVFCTVLSSVTLCKRLHPGIAKTKYCGSNNICCQNRNDECSHTINDSFCYCDQFCKRYEDGHNDCCHDYEAVCERGDIPVYTQVCMYMGQTYHVGALRRDECNKCTCVQDKNYPNNVTWSCDNNVCLISDDVINGINQLGSTWKAYRYFQFFKETWDRAKTFKLGTLRFPSERTRVISYNKDLPYPKSFDSRDVWPGFISPVIDQGWCGADWAISTANVLSDRFAIFSNGAEKTLISPQSLLSCAVRGQLGCMGGNIAEAWNYAQYSGLVDEDCFPYMRRDIKCHLSKDKNLPTSCKPTSPLRKSKYTAGPIGRLVQEEDIMYDILVNGPVQAIMTVYQDFFHYRSGVYSHSHFGNQHSMGLHSVRIVGWGEEQGNKYWVVANSWGQKWGEDGYFKIVRGKNESGIENFIVTVKPIIVDKIKTKKFFAKK